MIKEKIHMQYHSARGGQVLVVVILAVAVVLTVGISLAARTITNLKLSKQSEESQRAFQAAESGVENAIKNGNFEGSIPNTDLGNSSNYQTIVHLAGKGVDRFRINNGDSVLQDVGMDVWLSHHHDSNVSGDPADFSTDNMPAGTSFTVYWADSSPNLGYDCNISFGPKSPPAVEVIILSKKVGSMWEDKTYADPCPGSRSSGSASIGAGTTIEGTSYKYSVSLTMQGTGYIAKVIPLFNSSAIAIKASFGTFPSQGQVVDSTGKSGDTVRKISYYSPYPQMPNEYFSYGILSQ